MRKASKKTPSGEKRSEHFTPPKCFKLSHHCAVSTDFFLLSSFLFCSFFLAVFKGFPKNYFSLLKSCQSANRLLFQKKKKKKILLPFSFCFCYSQVLLLPAVACHCLSKFVWILSPSASCSHTHAPHSQRVLYLALTLVCSCVMKETHLLLLKCVCTYMCAVQSLL